MPQAKTSQHRSRRTHVEPELRYEERAEVDGAMEELASLTIGRMLDEIVKAIHYQRETLDRLANRLDPILRPDGPDFTLPDREKLLNSAPYYEMAIELLESIQRNTAHVETLVDRVQL